MFQVSKRKENPFKMEKMQGILAKKMANMFKNIYCAENNYLSRVDTKIALLQMSG